MALPVLVKNLVENKLAKYCDEKVPIIYWDELRIGYSIRDNSVKIFEIRPTFQDKTILVEVPVAKLKYDLDSGEWSLYSANRKYRWHKYNRLKPNKDIGVLIKEIEKDKTGIFWG
ncbi:MAG: DUF3024 domain-containing protein [Planctomycetota bacterium]